MLQEQTMCDQEDVYECMRQSDPPSSNAIYVNCLEDSFNCTEIKTASVGCNSQRDFNDDNVYYENDRKHANVMYVNGVSVVQDIYVNELPIADKGYVNAGNHETNSAMEGDYVYADVHSSDPSNNGSSKLEYGHALNYVVTNYANEGENKVTSCSGTDDNEAIYENNYYHLMLDSIDAEVENTDEEENNEVYVQMHSGSKG